MGRKQTTKRLEESEEVIRLEEKIAELEMNEKNRIHKKSVIGFVNEIEKAHQYFALKDKLKRDRTVKYNSSKDDLVKKLEQRAAFDRLGTQDIRYAVNAHIYELMQQMEYEQRTVYLPQLKEMEVEDWDGTITGEDVQRMERMFPCSALGNPDLLDRRAFVNPFYKLVYDVREKVARVVGDGQSPFYESEDDEDDRSCNLAEAIGKYREMIKFAKPELEYVKKRKAPDCLLPKRPLRRQAV